MTSPYKKFQQNQAERYSTRAIPKLVKGKLYEVYKFDIKPSTYKSETSILRAYIKDGLLNFLVYLPSDFNNTSEEDVKTMNKDIQSNEAPSLSFYGILGTKYVVRIHPQGEGIDTNLLETVSKIESVQTPPKKKMEDNSEAMEGAKKKLVMDD